MFDAGQYVPLGNNLGIAVAGTAVGLGHGLTNNAIPPGANAALIVVEGATPVNWRDDGNAPTAGDGDGVPLSDTVPYFWYRGTLSAFSMISTSGTVKVNVSFYKSVG